MALFRISKQLLVACLLTCTLYILAAAQSLDARFPSPVRSKELVGRIAARDIGDSRLTDHFYSFAGTPGDLLITIETRNLNGDIDIFTAGSLRPVLKLALYAETTSPVTKSIYLRQREELILRVEARSPNDDDGVYHLKFGGSFEALAGVAENAEEAPALPANRKGKRVSSVGARIDEPVPPQVDVAATSAPEPTSSNVTDPPPAEVKKEAPVEPTPAPAPAARVSRNTRTRPSSRRTPAKPAKATEESKPITEETVTQPSPSSASKATPSSEEATSEPAPVSRRTTKKSKPAQTETADAEPSASEPAATATKARNSKRSSTAKSRDVTEEPVSTPEPGEQSPAKIVIEMLDGTRFERFMSAVRRVTVESGQIVVTGTDGKVERIRLSTVVRMSIGP